MKFSIFMGIFSYVWRLFLSIWITIWMERCMNKYFCFLHMHCIPYEQRWTVKYHSPNINLYMQCIHINMLLRIKLKLQRICIETNVGDECISKISKRLSVGIYSIQHWWCVEIHVKIWWFRKQTDLQPQIV